MEGEEREPEAENWGSDRSVTLKGSRPEPQLVCNIIEEENQGISKRK